MSTKDTSTGGIYQDYLDQAHRHYIQLVPHFSQTSGYWEQGCILDSMIDFLHLAVPAGLIKLADAQSSLLGAGNNYNNNAMAGAWYDDWAWWANSTGKIYDSKYSALFAGNLNLHLSFHTICLQNFQFIKNGIVPPNRTMPDYYVGTMKAYDHAKQMAISHPGQGWEAIVTGADPVWNTGCWQAPMVSSSIDSSLDPTESSVSLGPFQDSVINGLFYIMCQRTLGQQNMGTRQDVEIMYSFYRNWMGMGSHSLTEDQQLYKRFSDGSGLLRERVSIYNGGTAIPTYHKDLAWAGDQGLFLSALTLSFFKQEGPQQMATMELIVSTINGVFNHMIGDISAEHQSVIMPWYHMGAQPQLGTPPGNDHGDYYSGTGVFMRGLLEASNIPAVKQYVQTTPQIQQVLGNTVAALQDGTVYRYHVDSNPFSNSTNEWFDDFNKMATLLVASELLS